MICDIELKCGGEIYHKKRLKLIQIRKGKDENSWKLKFISSPDFRFQHESFVHQIDYSIQPKLDSIYGEYFSIYFENTYDNLDSGSELREIHWNKKTGPVRYIYDEVIWERKL